MNSIGNGGSRCARTLTGARRWRRHRCTLQGANDTIVLAHFGLQSRGHGGESGQAMVEFAVMLPLLILMLLGGADLLMAISAHQQVSYVAQETAQWCLLGQGTAECSGAGGQAQTFAKQLGLINANNVSAHPNSCNNCVSVTATYSFTPLFHFFPSFTMASTAYAAPSPPQSTPPPSG